jgi:hypothetical protein
VQKGVRFATDIGKDRFALHCHPTTKAMSQVSGSSLWLTDAHKADLDFMKAFPAEVTGEFARLAIEFLQTGPNEKFFRQAAKKLKVPAETVEEGLSALGFLMLEAARVGLSTADMMVEALTINELGFDDAAKGAVASHYSQNVKQLRDIIATTKLTTPHYKDLEWRLDVQVASRSVRQQVKPTYLLKLHTHAKGSPVEDTEPTVMEADYASLKHITTELQAALQEANSLHQRRLARYIK